MFANIWQALYATIALVMAPDTLAGSLEAAWRHWPERVAVQQDDRRLTYADLRGEVLALARAYRRLGVTPGSRVACQLSNRPEHLVAVGAAWTCGAVHVGIDHQLTGRELSWLVGHSGATVLLYEPSDTADPMGPARAVVADHPQTRVVALEGDDATLLSYRQLLSHPHEGGDRQLVDHDGPGPDDPAVMFVTSGTTGKPKTPLGYHGPLAQGWCWLAAEVGFTTDDVHLGQLPLSHGFGLSMAVMALSTGGRLVLHRRFSPKAALSTIEAEQVTVLNGTPAHFIRLAEQAHGSRHCLGTLRAGVGTASGFPPAILSWILDDLRLRFMVMYGSSEGLSVVTTERDTILAGSVGRPEPGTVAVVGRDRQPVQAGEVGEVAFHLGYWPVRYWGGAPEDGTGVGAPGVGEERWYYTGDLGRLDAEGRLFVLGRLKDQIDRGGLKVDPGEVESLLLRCPGVADAAVIGAPDPVMGERVCACVVPAAGLEAGPALEQLRAALAGGLAPYKLPEHLHLMASLPRSAIGKVDRAKLRSEVASRAVAPSVVPGQSP